MKTFEERLQANYDELKWLYFELYGENYPALDSFCEMLREYDSLRSPELKEWDRKRTEKAREAIPHMGMQMYVDCFADTLKGVQEHLPYLNEVGIHYLHLMPLLRSPEGRSDGGYAVADFRCVEPKFGTMEDLSALAMECHKEDISICLDFVMNHTSEDHEWAIRARKGDPEAQSRYFFFDDWSVPNEYEKYVPQVFPQTAPGNFTWCEEAHKVVMTTFYPYQWDLNYRNFNVFNDMTADMLNLCNQGVDIVRLDATPYIWKTLGTNCRNLPQVHSLVRMMHIAADVVCPGTLLLGEVVMEPKEVVPYFGSVEKPECHMLYNVTTMATTWHTVATKDVRLLVSQLQKVFALPKEYLFLNYLRCHDDIGWGLDYPFLRQFGMEEVPHKRFLNDYFRGFGFGSEARGELYNDDPRLGDARLCGTTASLCGVEAAEYEGNKEKLSKALSLDVMLHAFLFTLSGIPMIYSGDEIGTLNDYTYHDNPLKREDSRYLHRGKFSWENAEKRGDLSTREGCIFSAIQELKRLRESHRAFAGSADTWVVPTGNDHVLGVGRYEKGEKLIAFFNFSGEPQRIYTSERETYREMAGSESFGAGNEAGGRERSLESLELPGYGFSWNLLRYSE